MTGTIRKLLSPNDTGETGGHQAGILIPKDRRILDFFPDLDASQLNPRVHLPFVDDHGRRWEFAFIYYNNRFFGGTRNEYRLTRMTQYMREHGIKAGDELVFFKDGDAVRRISYQRAREIALDDRGVLQLGRGWKVIDFAKRSR
jgi:hypothetical protein